MSARQSNGKTLADLKFSGQSIDEIASHLGKDRSEVVQHYRDTGRRSSATSEYLRQQGAHGSVIAASLGLQENPITLVDEEPDFGTETDTEVGISDFDDLLDLDVESAKITTSLREPVVAAPLDEKEDQQSVEPLSSDKALVAGQQVTIKDWVVKNKPELAPFAQKVMLIIDDDDAEEIWVSLQGEDAVGKDVTMCSVSYEEIEAYAPQTPWERGDEAFWLKDGSYLRCIVQGLLKKVDGEAAYAVRVVDTGAFGKPMYSELHRNAALANKMAGVKLFFYDSGCDITAVLNEHNSGCTVLAGSVGKSSRKKISESQIETRLRILEEGFAVVDGTELRVIQDCEFTSLSAAASVLNGAGTTGHAAWKDDTGLSYKELLAQSA